MLNVMVESMKSKTQWLLDSEREMKESEQYFRDAELRNWTLHVTCINGMHSVNLICADCGMLLSLQRKQDECIPDSGSLYDVLRRTVFGYPHTLEQCKSKQLTNKDANRIWDRLD